MGKEKYNSSWYTSKEYPDGRPFVVVEIPYHEDVEKFTQLLQKHGLHYDYKGITDGEKPANVYVVFNDE